VYPLDEASSWITLETKFISIVGVVIAFSHAMLGCRCRITIRPAKTYQTNFMHDGKLRCSQECPQFILENVIQFRGRCEIGHGLFTAKRESSLFSILRSLIETP